ncbi:MULTISPECIES: helix-turn-helix transcriptional regulator [unclassified Crossiella]|uniref:helix-turn-helix domain-containing protein n=1 Tax=unclassified Crossiella TaxID=2620835 RepID=UPI001FFFFB07|nr:MULTISPECIES: helix-turn-helix transcriptional regulator [unclassified Crossiella]MCK2241893.1 helix-turn-helix domain-containing protein [Crossiella sp. S99.2]MCK2255796.1 helix-turn-helix domain-containing protein [Crossiella sp. S99.1]
MPTPPTRKRRDFGRLLRDLRKRARLSVVELAELLRVGKSTLQKWESGHSNPAWAQVEVWLSHCNATQQEAEEVSNLWEMIPRSSPRTSLKLPDDTPRDFKEHARREQWAPVILTVSSIHIPGLLQTELLAQGQHRGVNSESAVAARMARQACLTRDQPANYRAIIDESVFMRLLGDLNGDVDAAVEQLRKIERLAERPNVGIYVHKVRDGAIKGSLATGCTIIGDPDDDTSWSAYLETSTGGSLMDNQDVVQHLRTAFNTAAKAALEPAESVAWIRKCREDLSSHENTEVDHRQL